MRTPAVPERFVPLATPWGRGLRLPTSDPASLREALAAAQPGAASDGWDVLKADGRARVLAGPTAAGAVVVKVWTTGGWRRRIADLFRGSPARRAWRGAAGLRARGIPAPAPRAYVERRRFGIPVCSAIVLEDLRDHPPADRCPPAVAEARELLAALVELALRLHRHGVAHGDLKASHALLGRRDGRLEARPIDLEGVRFKRRLSDRDRVRALAQLNASLPDCVPNGERRRAFARYADALPFACGGSAALRAVVASSLARSHRWTGGGCELARPPDAPGSGPKAPSLSD